MIFGPFMCVSGVENLWQNAKLNYAATTSFHFSVVCWVVRAIRAGFWPGVLVYLSGGGEGRGEFEGGGRRAKCGSIFLTVYKILK